MSNAIGIRDRAPNLDVPDYYGGSPDDYDSGCYDDSYDEDDWCSRRDELYED